MNFTKTERTRLLVVTAAMLLAGLFIPLPAFAQFEFITAENLKRRTDAILGLFIGFIRFHKVRATLNSIV